MENYIGNVIGIYKILYECDYRSNDGHKMFHVKCVECEYETDMQLRHIKRAKKCTHMNYNGTKKRYGYVFNNKSLRSLFGDMKNRCYNKNYKDYRWYGEKGIKICDEWINNPLSFEEWALSNGYQNGLTIDRIDENKDYCPDNCRWISIEENSKWKSTTREIEVNGIVDSGRGWSKRLGYSINYINTYIRKYGIEEALKFIKEKLSETC